MNGFSYMWLALIIIFFAIEAATYNLTTIWFAIASVVGFVLSAFNTNIWVQLIIALIVSVLLLIYTKPFAEKKLKVKTEPTNSDMVIGKTGIVVSKITSDKFAGEVNVRGKIWSAVSKDGDDIFENEKVKILSIDGVKLIVEREE
jgi:membrane protein implicated in regulation of membrane protease activity